MVLDKIVKLNLAQRLRIFILGTERPNLLTRLSVFIAFVVWIYFFTWHLISLLSLLLIDNLKQAATVRAAYTKIGHRYHFSDTINRLTLYSLIEVTLYGVLLIGLILIWRKKKTGLLIHIVGNLFNLVITFLLMGYSFMINEIPIYDYCIILAMILYFSIGLIVFYRQPLSLINTQ